MSRVCQKLPGKVSQEQVPWTELPFLVLEQIYSFLQREDQVNLSLVCRKWSEGYGSPSVWKKFKFKLTESQLSMKSYPLMKFVHKYSNLFREVKITCESFSGMYVWTLRELFIEFLEILTSSSQLTSVKLKKLNDFFKHTRKESHKELFGAITEFLKSQHRLKRVEFHDCSFLFLERSEILKILSVSTGKSLNHLVVLDFYNALNELNEQIDPNTEEKLPRILRLPQLKTLKTDFLPIFEYLFEYHSNDIQKCEHCRTHVFSKLTLISSYRFPQYWKPIIRRVSSNNWKILRNLCPDLQVELRISSLRSDEDMKILIVPNMPIRNLQYVFYFSINKIKSFFDHLLACKTDEYLVNLRLKWLFRTTDFASTLNPFLQSCTKLKCLKLTIVDPTSDIYGLLHSWLENRPPSLENVYVYTENRDQSPGYMILKMAVDELAPRLELIGLKVQLGPSGQRF